MITHVAIRFQDKVWSLPAPNRHHNVIRLIAETLSLTHVDARDRDQGFLNDKGEFLGRGLALIYAYKHKQIREDVPVIGDRLYSENLW